MLIHLPEKNKRNIKVNVLQLQNLWLDGLQTQMNHIIINHELIMVFYTYNKRVDRKHERKKALITIIYTAKTHSPVQITNFSNTKLAIRF